MNWRVLALAASLTWAVGAYADEDANLDVSYSETSKELTIKFNDGSKYTYADVSAETAADLQKAESKGEYFNKNIRGKYKATKVTE